MNAFNPPSRRRISNPTSTGGAGTLFEQQVDAAFLALLLVRGIPPILSDCTVTEVYLQTELEGWATDDVLVVGVNGGGVRRRLACQVKLSFTVSSSDQECKDTIADFWTDFCENAEFAPANDQFAIVTLRGTNTLLGPFASLLDCARASRDAVDFEHRLQTPGFVNARVVRDFGELQKIVNERAGRTVSQDELWRFLKVMHVLSMDLNTSTRQTETQYKTLLAHTANGSDPIGAADATWAELVRQAGDGMTHGKSYRRDDLPQELLERHSAIADSSQAGLRRLTEHSEVILNGIRSTIGGDVHLCRKQLVQSLLEKLEETQVVVVTGPAGSGKSGIAKEAVLQLANHFAFSFRAEEFATAHLDETLHRSQIPANAVMLAALMAGQSRKLLLVESVERLLEASTRDAFSDLLTLLKNDGSWRLILSCRDYSSELVRSSMLQFAGVEHSVLAVPPLDDPELAAVEASLPQLSRPLSNPSLQRLLRNPYLLDKASQMDWPADRPLPEDERAFRAKFWAEIIRADDRAADDLPRRRQDTIVEIALRRARALTQYVPRGELDSGAILALRRDSLIIHSEVSDALVAPAHDVLEDWSILKWIEEQYAICNRSLPDLSAALGTYPAIRRTYRKWVSELVERDSVAADNLFDSVISDPSLSSQFRDDTLVSLLQSSMSGDLLQRHSASLFANNRQVLRRIIHLLRVACVTTPPWFGCGGAVASLMHVPEGAVWKSVLQLVVANLFSFGTIDLPLILGLAEDAARGVNWQTPYPEGAEFISAIGSWLLPQFDDYASKGQRKRVLQVIAKLPNCNREVFAKLLAGDPEGDGRELLSDDFRELVLWSMEGMAACRDMPDNVIAAVREDLLLTEEMLQDEYSYGGMREVDDALGIRRGTHFHSFPASAFCGPFLQLLRFHSEKAIAFIVDLFDHSAEWYGRGRLPLQFVEMPYETTLTFADGTQKTQWCNVRLWNLYRGTSVGPYVLQSALMALEKWLLSIAGVRASELDGMLCTLLRRTASASITAAVASVATAYPRLSPETLLTLLSSRDSILLDRGRMAVESEAVTLGRMTPLRNAEQRICDDERRQANAMGHRRHDLEAAIAIVQLGPHAERIQQIIDAHRGNMQPVDEQDDEDRIWRLSLHRMDLRQYTVSSPYQENRTEPAETETSAETRPRMIRLDLNDADPDVQQMVDTGRDESTSINVRLSVAMWGIKVFLREEDLVYDPALWRARLEEAQELQSRAGTDDQFELGRGGPEHVAAVCIRDYYDEMTTEERDWCIETVCRAVESDADNWNETARMQCYSMGGDRPSAWILSCLMCKMLPDMLDSRVRCAFTCAVLHPVDEIRGYAASGVGHYLWSSNPELAIRCVNVLAMEAKAVQERLRAELDRQYSECLAYSVIECECGTQMRREFYGSVEEHAYEQLDIKDWPGSEANSRILTILCQAPTQELAINGFRRLAAVMVEWWDEDEERDGHDRRERSIDVQIAITSLLEDFVLKVTPQQGQLILEPILNAVDRHPKEATEILQGIVGFEDRHQRTEQFWHLWELFAERARAAPWLAHLDREHSSGGPAMDAIFLTQYWKDDVRHWRSLEGHAFRVHRLFQTLPPTATVLDDYVRFLYHIGEQSLPAAFPHIAERLQAGDPQSLLRIGNTVFMLEALLRRYVYGRPLQLKADRELRESVLYLLDALVESGSSSAYRMRDDFVTPAH